MIGFEDCTRARGSLAKWTAFSLGFGKSRECVRQRERERERERWRLELLGMKETRLAQL